MFIQIALMGLLMTFLQAVAITLGVLTAILIVMGVGYGFYAVADLFKK